MLMLKMIGWLFKVLKEGPTPGQVAGGLVFGFAVGLIPGWPVQVVVLVLLILILNVNLSMTFMGVAIGSAASWILSPLLDALGGWILHDFGALQGLWTAMYNYPPMALTRFNDTIVMGSFSLALIGGVIAFPLVKMALGRYREKVLPRLKEYRLVRWFMSTRLFGFYLKLERMGLV